MDVSVIIPTYEPGSYLFDCIDSLVIQTLDKRLFEVLVILNGRKQPHFDSIQRYLRQFANVNINLSYCSIPHVSAARNQGIELAKGQYLIFIDDDDLISTTYVERLWEKSTPKGLVFSNVLSFETHVDDFKKINLSNSFDRNRNIKPSWMTMRSHLSLVWGKLIPKEIISEDRFDLKFKNGQDSLFMALISSKIKEYRLSEGDAIYYWRTRSNSASRKSKTIFYEIKNAVALMSAFLKIYFSKPLSYNFWFFVTRLLAVNKRLLYRLPKSRLFK